MAKTPTVHNPTNFEPSDYEVVDYLDNKPPVYYGQGIAALMMLNLMEQFPLREFGFQAVEALHVMIEAKKLAYADMLQHVADPRFAAPHVPAMLRRQRPVAAPPVAHDRPRQRHEHDRGDDRGGDEEAGVQARDVAALGRPGRGHAPGDDERDADPEARPRQPPHGQSASSKPPSAVRRSAWPGRRSTGG